MNQTTPISAAQSQPLLFEMLRSFVTLAQTLNLSHAVAELNSTRQTVRRHISQLEEAKGIKLFTTENRHYRLTPQGAQVLPEARDLLARGDAWLTGQSRLINGLQYLSYVDQDGWCHYQQQHPIASIFDCESGYLRGIFQAWALAGGDLEHPALQQVRPDCTVSRQVGGNWIFTEVGERSSFVSWFGWARARSSIGAALPDMPGGAGFASLAGQAYYEVETTRSVRLDHVHTMFVHGDQGEFLPISYQRLLLAAHFPDRSYAMLSAVRRTYEIEIADLPTETICSMPKDMLM